MSFKDDQETWDIITRSGQRIRVRLYQDEDYQCVRDLFMYCMGNGPGAPREAAIVDQLHQPFAYAAYSICTVGLALAIRPTLPQAICKLACRASSLLPSPIRMLTSKIGISRVLNYLRFSRLFSNLHLRSRAWPLVLSVVSAGSLLAFLTFLNYAFLGYCKDCLNGDLKNVTDHYQNPEALEKGGQFWVIEDVDKDRIIACVGLDTTGFVPEIRRMGVHPSYRRLGLGHRLIEAILEHTIKHNAQCKAELKILDITLETSVYQPGAIRMYEQHGWVVERKEQPAWYVKGFYLVTMRRKMDASA